MLKKKQKIKEGKTSTATRYNFNVCINAKIRKTIKENF